MYKSGDLINGTVLKRNWDNVDKTLNSIHNLYECILLILNK